MVCDESLRFNANESKLLSRGPKDMVRQELSLEEFRVQMEKMIVKQKLDNAFKDDMGDEDDLSGKQAMHRAPAPVKPTTNHTCSKAGNVSSEVSDRCKECIKEFNIKWEESSCSMQSLFHLLWNRSPVKLQDKRLIVLQKCLIELISSM